MQIIVLSSVSFFTMMNNRTVKRSVAFLMLLPLLQPIAYMQVIDSLHQYLLLVFDTGIGKEKVLPQWVSVLGAQI